MNDLVIERVYLEDPKLKIQTITHHKERYIFASKVRVVNSGEFALDLACGSGYGTDLLREAGYISCGVDIDEKAIKYAKNKFKDNIYIKGDVGRFFNPLGYKLIVLFEAIEHISYEEGLKVIENVKGMLDKDGYFIVSTPRDINNKYNMLHKSLWDYVVLKNILSSKFKSVEMWGQDWDSGIISKVNPESNDFFIAVCHD
jgi:2-polyprenyl-3-methyl-5-hydroxy-6-metoxy-1,4-benzoquinol methylase